MSVSVSIYIHRVQVTFICNAYFYQEILFYFTRILFKFYRVFLCVFILVIIASFHLIHLISLRRKMLFSGLPNTPQNTALHTTCVHYQPYIWYTEGKEESFINWAHLLKKCSIQMGLIIMAMLSAIGFSYHGNAQFNRNLSWSLCCLLPVQEKPCAQRLTLSSMAQENANKTRNYQQKVQYK